MRSADLTALRATCCKVHARLGAALLHLEDAEAQASAPACAPLVHLSLDAATADLEGAAAHLADLVAAADRATTALASTITIGTAP